jgi:hypothetical protein
MPRSAIAIQRPQWNPTNMGTLAIGLPDEVSSQNPPSGQWGVCQMSSTQSAPLVIVQQNAFLAQLFLEYPVLSAKVVDDNLLLPVDPSGENEEIQLPGL